MFIIILDIRMFVNIQLIYMISFTNSDISSISKIVLEKTEKNIRESFMDKSTLNNNKEIKKQIMQKIFYIILFLYFQTMGNMTINIGPKKRKINGQNYFFDSVILNNVLSYFNTLIRKRKMSNSILQ